MAVQTKIQVRRDTAANWVSTNPTLAAGEIGLETTGSGGWKMGDGTTSWAGLRYRGNPLPLGYPPPVGSWQFPNNTTGTAAVTAASQRLSLVPFDVGPNSSTSYSALAIRTAVAQVGGTTTTTLAAYPDDGSGGQPNFAGGPIVSSAVSLASVGTVQGSVSWNNVTPGRYWLAFLYVVTSAPSTVATVYSASNGSSLWAGTPGSITYGLVNTSQTSMPTSAITLTATASIVIPVYGLVSARTTP